jgi:hypothetical protein
MRTIVCCREGRYGCHVGDTVEIADDVDVFDMTYFREVLPPDGSETVTPKHLRKAKPDADILARQPETEPEPDTEPETKVRTDTSNWSTEE